jgi:hypothetical protein
MAAVRLFCRLGLGATAFKHAVCPGWFGTRNRQRPPRATALITLNRYAQEPISTCTGPEALTFRPSGLFLDAQADVRSALPVVRR